MAITVGNICPDWRPQQPIRIETIPIIPKEDGRKLPIAYPQLGGERDLSTGCKFGGEWERCTFGRKSSHDPGCTYHRFGTMCDKIVSKEGKEYN
jgi:hypothetical protein